MQDENKLTCINCKGFSNDLTVKDLKTIGESLKLTKVNNSNNNYLVEDLDDITFCHYDWHHGYPLIRYYLDCEKDEDILVVDDFGWQGAESEEYRLRKIMEIIKFDTLWFSETGPSLAIGIINVNDKSLKIVVYSDAGYSEVYFTRKLVKELKLDISEIHDEYWDSRPDISYTVKDLKYALKYINKSYESSLDSCELTKVPKGLVKRFKKYYVKCLDEEDISEYFSSDEIPDFIEQNCCEAEEKLRKYISSLEV